MTQAEVKGMVSGMLVGETEKYRHQRRLLLDEEVESNLGRQPMNERWVGAVNEYYEWQV